jgi:hypothetical protein
MTWWISTSGLSRTHQRSAHAREGDIMQLQALAHGSHRAQSKSELSNSGHWQIT